MICFIVIFVLLQLIWNWTHRISEVSLCLLFHTLTYCLSVLLCIKCVSCRQHKVETCFSSSSVQSLSRVQLLVTPWTAARQASLSISNCRSPPKPMSIEFVMPSNHLTLCHPLLLLHSLFPRIRVFSNESALCIRWPKYWSFSFNISPSNEYSESISCRMGWIDLLAVQGTLKSLLQPPQLKSINSSALSLLYSPTLTSVYDYWKNRIFDYTDILSARWCLCFSIHCLCLS